jgi:two-component system phosphate regulon sensor histidine kinase PhoR
MSQQADRMTALIDDLLSLNRIEMRAHRTPTECVNLEATVREAMDLARPSAEAANVTIEVEPSTSPATVRGDASELRQIAINLLQNAIKYGASGERVDVLLRDAVEGGVRMVELQVRDYGPGIAPEHLPRLTERFYRAHEDSNPLATGNRPWSCDRQTYCGAPSRAPSG